MIRLLKPGEAAYETGLDRTRIDAAITAGTLPAIDVAREASTRRAWRISPAALQAWIDAGCPTSAA